MLLALSIVLIVISMTTKYIIEQRRLARKSYTGVEHFKSYEKAVGTRFFEGLLLSVSWLMLWAGLLSLTVMLADFVR